MRIKSFKFDDHRADWHLEETKFDAFNLLVGVSGVGKTKILEALGRVCRVATEAASRPGQIEWAIEFEHDGQSYRWEGRTEAVRGSGVMAATLSLGQENGPVEIAREKIICNGDDILVDRGADQFVFDRASMPALNRSLSAIYLLTDEEKIKPLARAFRFILSSAGTSTRLETDDASTVSAIDNIARTFLSRVASPQSADSTQYKLLFDTFRAGFMLGLLNPASDSDLGLEARIPLFAYYTQEGFPEEFQRVRDLFISTFPSTQDLKISWSSKVGGKASGFSLEFSIQEGGTSTWISQHDMSSGMLRTLVHLFELSLAPPGSVIIIDEFENSLGVNCMQELTDFIMSRAPDLQFILTSHHPYVINKIPPETWKLVTRKGGRVRVLSAKDIPSLQKVSHQQAFIRLINLPEFEEGIS